MILGKALTDKIFKPSDLVDFATNDLGMNIRIREKEVNGRAYLKVTIIAPMGVLLHGKPTETMSFEISGKLEGKNSAVTHYLVLWAAAALIKLRPQINSGIITDEPVMYGATA